MLEVRDLHVRYGALHVLQGVDLLLQTGEVVAIEGANSAGKTSLLNALAGVITPAQGSVWLDERRLAGQAEEIHRRGVCLVPEGRQLFPSLTVEQNLRMGAFARRREIHDLDEELTRIGAWFPVLQRDRQRLAGLLSGGEQQMLAVGRALMGKPRLLLLDEPSLGLAPALVQRLFDIIRQINRETRLSILMVEQDMALMRSAADRLVTLASGRLIPSA